MALPPQSVVDAALVRVLADNGHSPAERFVDAADVRIAVGADAGAAVILGDHQRGFAAAALRHMGHRGPLHLLTFEPESPIAAVVDHLSFPASIERAKPGDRSPVSAAASVDSERASLVTNDVRGLFEQHGVDLVEEFGVARGEVLGLEVAVVDSEGAVHIGVGSLDRAVWELSDAAADRQLGDVVGIVRNYRRPGQGLHPANSLARDRWLRAVISAAPQSVGATQLTPLPSAPRHGLRESHVAASTDGSGHVFVCLGGPDPALLLPILEVVVRIEATKATLVAPQSDIAIIERLAAVVAVPTDVVGFDPPWT